VSFLRSSLNQACFAISLSLGTALSSLAPWHTSAVQAFPLTWTLDNANFNDGARATGKFDFDADTSDYTNINITINGGTLPGFPYPLTFTESDLALGLPNQLAFRDGSTLNYLYLSFADVLTNTGGTVAIGSNSIYENQNGVVSNSPGGSVTAVPLPAAWTGAIAFAALTTRKLKGRHQSESEQPKP
jgi:hypothetical protein